MTKLFAIVMNDNDPVPSSLKTFTPWILASGATPYSAPPTVLAQWVPWPCVSAAQLVSVQAQMLVEYSVVSSVGMARPVKSACVVLTPVSSTYAWTLAPVEGAESLPTRLRPQVAARLVSSRAWLKSKCASSARVGASCSANSAWKPRALERFIAVWSCAPVLLVSRKGIPRCWGLLRSPLAVQDVKTLAHSILRFASEIPSYMTIHSATASSKAVVFSDAKFPILRA
mmetsp:Transcript_63577/g.178928  ORF Transcript_63577/g.178928 Transcript_63577/m.178928 type:complete len:228 (-) Transcript_63577:171-854(-)